jgi:hypothetical protein
MFMLVVFVVACGDVADALWGGFAGVVCKSGRWSGDGVPNRALAARLKELRVDDL